MTQQAVLAAKTSRNFPQTLTVQNMLSKTIQKQFWVPVA